jgi:hypothetical protein
VRTQLVTALVLAIVLSSATAYTSFVMPGSGNVHTTQLRVLAGATGSDPYRPLGEVLGASVDWTDNCQGLFDPVSGLLRPVPVGELIAAGPSFLRFPATDLSQHYDWTLGVGTFKERGSNPSHGRYPQVCYFGTDEFIALANHTGATPVLVVNAATANATLAAEWVSYCNDPYTQGKGVLRAKNGHKAPYDVRYWEIGFDMYQPSYWEDDPDQTTLPGVKYAREVIEFSKEMKAVDPDIKVGITLVLHPDVEAGSVDPSWNANVLREAAGSISDGPAHGKRLFDYVVVKVELPRVDVLLDMQDLFAYSYARTFMSLQEDLIQLRGLLYPPNEVPIAISSFMPYYGPKGWNTDASSQAGSAVVTANIAMEAISAARASDPHGMLYACYGDLSSRSHTSLLISPDFEDNHAGRWERSPSFFALELCRQLEGMHPLEMVRVRSSEYSIGGERSMAALRGVPYVDGVAVIDADLATVRLLLVNRATDGTSRVLVEVEGWSGQMSVTRTAIDAPSLQSTNLLEERVRTTSEGHRVGNPSIGVDLPPGSVVLLTLVRTGVT